MHKKSVMLTFLSIFLLTILGFGHNQKVEAASYQTNYTVLKAGTGQASYADAYFSKPAVVTANSDSYTVSLTVSTDHSLGSFPVQVLNVNGQAPQVSKSTSGNRDNYVVTFTTKSVKQVMSGNMKVDIDNINYHHVYGFNLRMDAGNVPALTSQQSSQASQTQAKPAATQSQQKSAAASNSSTKQVTSSSAATSSQASSSSSSAKSSSSSSSSSQKQSSSSSQKKVKKAAKKAATSSEKKVQKDQVKPKSTKKTSSSAAWWIGGLAVVAIIGGVVYFIKK